MIDNIVTISAVILVFFIVPFWITKPTKADIQACVKHTGYSVERCNYELNR